MHAGADARSTARPLGPGVATQLGILACAGMACGVCSLHSKRLPISKHGKLLTVILLVSLMAISIVLSGLGYSARPDVEKSGPRRGECSPGDGDTEQSLVSELYQFASYDVAKTEWPIYLLLSVIGAISIGAVVDPTSSWSKIACVALVVSLLVYSFGSAFCLVHGHMQAQIIRDAIYCKYNVLRARQEAARRAP